MSRIVQETKLLARHSTIYAIGNMLRRVASLLLLPLYTTYLTPNDYGIKEMVGISTEVVGVLLATAITSAIYRFYFARESEEDRNCVITTSCVTIGVAGIVTVVVLWLAAARPLASTLLDDPSLSDYFVLSFVTLLFQSQNHVAFAYLRANQRSVKLVILSLAQLLIVIGLNLYFIISREMGVLGILVSTFMGAIFVFLVLTLPTLIRMRLRFDRHLLANMLRFGLPMIPAQLGGMVVHLSDRFFLKAYTSLADTGVYSVAYRFGTAPSQFISEPFNNTWLPRRFEIAKDPDSVQIFGRIFTGFLALIVFVGLGLSCVVGDLLQIIADPRFWPAASLVPIIVLANIIFTFHYHFNIGILLKDKTSYLAWISGSNAALIILLNFLLIPRYGVVGAALATLIGFSFKAVATYVVGRRLLQIRFEFRRVGTILLSAAAIYLGLGFVHISQPWTGFFVRGVAVVILYPAVLLVARFFTASEIEWVRRKIGRLWPRWA